MNYEPSEIKDPFWDRANIDALQWKTTLRNGEMGDIC